MLDLLSDHSELCVKTIDRDGVIRHVNRRGLHLVGLTAEQFCNRRWADLWEGTSRHRIEAALETAFSGQSVSLEEMMGETPWTIAIYPLPEPDGTVMNLLAISQHSDPVRHPANANERPELAALDETRAALGEAVHAMGNLLSTVGSAARILKRSPADPLVDAVIGSLESAYDRGLQPLEKLRDLRDLSAKN
ncbi:PAS domain-containing protein [Litorisediminicola beolgyonensis]